jgi:hypothetical protein
LVWFGLVWFGLARLHSYKRVFGLVWFSPSSFLQVSFGLVWFDLVWFGLAAGMELQVD